MLVGGSSQLEPDLLAAPSRLHTPIAGENRHYRQSPPGRCLVLEQQLGLVVRVGEAGPGHHGLNGHSPVVLNAASQHVAVQTQDDVHEGA